jgi:hypothetical protein
MSNPPATALDVLTALQGSTPGAQKVLESYFASGPDPRFDTPGQQATAYAELEAG